MRILMALTWQLDVEPVIAGNGSRECAPDDGSKNPPRRMKKE